MTKAIQIRQGDVFLLPVADIPADWPPTPDLAARSGVVPVPAEDGRVVLAHGEATGHHHSFAHGRGAALYREDGAGGGLYLIVSGDAPAPLEHQEHLALPASPADYRVVRQREWTDADEPIEVAD